jgi:molybdopterin-guanine dinucleotide biosynthesis protein B
MAALRPWTKYSWAGIIPHLPPEGNPRHNAAMAHPVRVFGLAGWSGAGKTVLLTRLIPHLVANGLRVSTVKRAHHDFDVDREGKDSWAHRQAGATEVLVASSRRFALMHELRGEPELPLPALLERLGPADLVLIEGFKREKHPKLEVFRADNRKSPLHPDDRSIVAIASDVPFPDAGRPVVGLDDIAAIAAIVLREAIPLPEA